MARGQSTSIIGRMPSQGRFHDRREAGRLLADQLRGMRIDDPVVMALPRGGVPVGFEVARALGVPLDIMLVRKLGAPVQPELGIGALGEDGTVIVDSETVAALGLTSEDLDVVIEREAKELERRRRHYRRDMEAVDVAGRTVLLVDDGLATGVTAAAAVRVLRARGADRVILAVPVCPAGAAERLGDQVGELVALRQPQHFGGVGSWYEDFSQTPDREVVELLHAGRAPATAPGVGDSAPIEIETRDGAVLEADLHGPADPAGLIVFVHGSGSSRRSPRNVAVARYLERLGFATLLFDLLTVEEAENRRNVFDIELLTRRLVDVTRWSAHRPDLAELPRGYFGASTGAAAALRAAAELDPTVAAVVSRGGRPDLAGHALARVTSPTLLIVGGDDWNVLDLNTEAAAELGGPHELAVVPGAGHLFEERGALARVAQLAGDWFERYICSRDGGPALAGGGRSA